MEAAGDFSKLIGGVFKPSINKVAKQADVTASGQAALLEQLNLIYELLLKIQEKIPNQDLSAYAKKIVDIKKRVNKVKATTEDTNERIRWMTRAIQNAEKKELKLKRK